MSKARLTCVAHDSKKGRLNIERIIPSHVSFLPLHISSLITPFSNTLPSLLFYNPDDKPGA